LRNGKGMVNVVITNNKNGKRTVWDKRYCCCR